MESNNKISKEVATQQLEEFLDYYEIDDDSFVDEAQLNAYIQVCGKLKKAIQKGRLTITNDDGIKIKQSLKNSYDGDVKEFDYAELAGKHKLSMGKKKDTDHYGRMYALLGSLTSMGEAAIGKLKGSDLSTAECLGFLFLQV